ncbi:MAG: hypothetical protein AAF985_08965 [Bacteroidota bacterium]
MKQLLQQMAWQFKLLHRNHLIAISLILTLFYGAVFFFLKDLTDLSVLLTVLIYNDPALIGLTFVGLSLMLEKNEGVFSLWLVTPVDRHIYLLARLLPLSLIGWACALGMCIFALGTSFAWLQFSFAAFAACSLFGLAGMITMSGTTEILMYALKLIPGLLLMSLPFLNYFQLTDWSLLALWPIQGSLDLMVDAYGMEDAVENKWWAYLSTSIWLGILYAWAYRAFYSKMVKM